MVQKLSLYDIDGTHTWSCPGGHGDHESRASVCNFRYPSPTPQLDLEFCAFGFFSLFLLFFLPFASVPFPSLSFVALAYVGSTLS